MIVWVVVLTWVSFGLVPFVSQVLDMRRCEHCRRSVRQMPRLALFFFVLFALAYAIAGPFAKDAISFRIESDHRD